MKIDNNYVVFNSLLVLALALASPSGWQVKANVNANAILHLNTSVRDKEVV